MEFKHTYTLPEADVIYTTLRNFNNVGGDIERVYRLFADRSAGRELNAAGVYLAWTMASTEIAKLEAATPFLVGMLDIIYLDCAAVLFVDNPAFIAEVNDWYERVQDRWGA